MPIPDDPFDHNGECTFCDEQGMHTADCPWIEQLVAEVDQLRELVQTDEKTITHNLAEIERLHAEVNRMVDAKMVLGNALEAEIARLQIDNASLRREVEALHQVVDRLHGQSPDK